MFQQICSSVGHLFNYSPTKLDPDCDAYKKWQKSKKFDPSRSGVLAVLNAQSDGNFSVDKKAVIEARIYSM